MWLALKWRNGVMSQECRQPLAAGKVKEMDSLLGRLE